MDLKWARERMKELGSERDAATQRAEAAERALRLTVESIDELLEAPKSASVYSKIYYIRKCILDALDGSGERKEG